MHDFVWPSCPALAINWFKLTLFTLNLCSFFNDLKVYSAQAVENTPSNVEEIELINSTYATDKCSNCLGGILCELCDWSVKIRRERHNSGSAMATQANKMLMRSNRLLRPVSEGDNVLVPIPSVDRGRGDTRNLLCYVLNVSHDSYKLGTAYGILDTMFTWSQFITTTFQGFTESDIKKIVKFRYAVRLKHNQ